MNCRHFHGALEKTRKTLLAGEGIHRAYYVNTLPADDHQWPFFFTKEGNPWLAKRPLKINGRLSNHRLTYVVKEATGLHDSSDPLPYLLVTKIDIHHLNIKK